MFAVADLTKRRSREETKITLKVNYTSKPFEKYTVFKRNHTSPTNFSSGKHEINTFEPKRSEGTKKAFTRLDFLEIFFSFIYIL